MKKIWPLLLLLLLLIILCVWTKKDSMHLSSNANVSNGITSALASKTKHINYTIKQAGKAYTLTGNFGNKEQENSLSDTCTAAASNLIIKETSTDKSLVGEDVINLTNKILPHFIANYSNGEISYKNKTLTVNGDVEGYDAKRTMQTLLNASTIASTDNTKVTLVEPINFNIKKDAKQFQLSGTFTNKKQIRRVSKHLRPTFTTVNLRKNAHRIDKGAIDLTEKILPSFTQNYTHGEITYTYETLIVKGSVKSQAALDEMNNLLSSANIAVENFSVLDPMVSKQIQAEKDALLAKEKAALEAKLAQEATAQRLADEDSRRKAAQKAATEAEALAKQKALQEASAKEANVKLALQSAQTAKANIVKLLKIENIEFEVAKGSLTKKGKSTVDKLANILKQYPNINVEIAGHTDSDGAAQFNQKLSQARVNTVKTHLISKGIQAKHLTAKGYGESKPLVPNTSDANKAKNRRVEINTQGN
jgi:outer membrane protein OmpA-like peptidoglycan-associated protein